MAATPEFLRGVRDLCDRHRASLVFDEVQCGLGRLGTLHAYQSYGVVPDMITLAKPLAGGLPLGAVLLNDAIESCLKPGQHGSTFSGGPAACAVGVRVFDTIAAPEFLARVQARSERLRAGMQALVAESPLLCGVRGRGLMLGLVARPGKSKRVPEVIRAARDRALLVTRAGQDVVRLLPPLNCSDAEVDEALSILGEALAAVAATRSKARPAVEAAGAASPLPVTAGTPLRRAGEAPVFDAGPVSDAAPGRASGEKVGTQPPATQFESITVSEGEAR
jgi:acetylornithine/succinyldiaminopimelate/putrescine aminotransferase